MDGENSAGSNGGGKRGQCPGAKFVQGWPILKAKIKVF